MISPTDAEKLEIPMLDSFKTERKIRTLDSRVGTHNNALPLGGPGISLTHGCVSAQAKTKLQLSWGILLHFHSNLQHNEVCFSPRVLVLYGLDFPRPAWLSWPAVTTRPGCWAALHQALSGTVGSLRSPRGSLM